MGKTSSLPPGFRFHPTDVELVKYYLKRKILGKIFSVEAIAEIDVYKHAPCDLPEKSCLKTKDRKWYFFCPRERKYASGSRINRATECGYWKTTGNDRSVKYNGEVAGKIKTLVFHHGRAPDGKRTNWVMHEYRLEDKDLSHVKDLYVLCAIFLKEGSGPRNGAQYGAPFKEEDWTDNEEDTCEAGPSLSNSLLVNTGHGAGSSQAPPQDIFVGSSSESCVTGTIVPIPMVIQPVPSNDVGCDKSVAIRPPSPKCLGVGSSLGSFVSDVIAPGSELPPPVPSDDCKATLPALDENDPLSFLYEFVGEEDSFMLDGNDKVRNTVNQDDEADFFEGLPDLDNLLGPSWGGIDVPDTNQTTRPHDEAFWSDYGHYLEMSDLVMPLCPSAGAIEDEVPFNRLSASFNCNLNSGETSYQANNAEMWLGRSYGSEDCFKFDSSNVAAQNHPPQPEMTNQHPEALMTNQPDDIIYGSQSLHDWRAK